MSPAPGWRTIGLRAIDDSGVAREQPHMKVWVRDTLITLPMLGVIGTAILVRKPVVQMICALVQAATTTYYMIVAINIAP